MIPVFIISILPADHPQLAALLEAVRHHDLAPVLIDGVRGAQLRADEYFALAKRYYLETQRFMTPGEVGCTMSHVAAWRRIIADGVDRAIVLEDDSLLDEEFGDRIRALCGDARLGDSLISLGGQEGKLGLARSIRGRPLDGLTETWEVCPADLTRLTGTVGYVISKSVAQRLLQESEAGAFIVDDFPRLHAKGAVTRFFISNVIGHPWENVRSAIQQERAEFMKHGDAYHRPLSQRLVNEIRATLHARRRDREETTAFAAYRPIPWVSRFQHHPVLEDS